jgi:hypothetical protein
VTWKIVGRVMRQFPVYKPVYRWVWPLALLALTACASAPKPWVAPVRVPAELATEVPEPVLADKPDNGDLAAWADELRAALREANRRLRAIRGL